MNNCIFCKIAGGEIDAVTIWEDEKFLAFLDINPNTEGMTLVIPKQHFDSDTFEMPQTAYLELMSAAKKVSKLLKKGLSVDRVAMAMEGMGVDHAHIKLYPLHGIQREFREMLAKDRIYFDKYEGYISTQLGPHAETDDLKEIAREIKKRIKST